MSRMHPRFEAFLKKVREREKKLEEWDFSQQVYVQPGDEVTVELGASEVCMSMGVAGRQMKVKILSGTHGPVAQLLRPDGGLFSAPILMSEAGFYQDENGWYFYPPKAEAPLYGAEAKKPRKQESDYSYLEDGPEVIRMIERALGTAVAEQAMAAWEGEDRPAYYNRNALEEIADFLGRNPNAEGADQLEEDIERVQSLLFSKGEARRARAPKQEGRPLWQIAQDIRQNWPNVNYGAAPYLDAMGSLDSIHDSFGYDSAKSVVAYFLANASSWKGDKAREIKGELKALMKESRSRHEMAEHFLTPSKRYPGHPRAKEFRFQPDSVDCLFLWPGNELSGKDPRGPDEVASVGSGGGPMGSHVYFVGPWDEAEQVFNRKIGELIQQYEQMHGQGIVGFESRARQESEEFTYKVRVDGEWKDVTGPPPNRGDMSYWGITRGDIKPPAGYRLDFDDATKEPVFVPESAYKPTRDYEPRLRPYGHFQNWNSRPGGIRDVGQNADGELPEDEENPNIESRHGRSVRVARREDLDYLDRVVVVAGEDIGEYGYVINKTGDGQRILVELDAEGEQVWYEAGDLKTLPAHKESRARQEMANDGHEMASFLTKLGFSIFGSGNETGSTHWIGGDWDFSDYGEEFEVILNEDGSFIASVSAWNQSFEERGAGVGALETALSKLSDRAEEHFDSMESRKRPVQEGTTADFLNNPNGWPQYPKLPLIRGGFLGDTAVVVHGEVFALMGRGESYPPGKPFYLIRGANLWDTLPETGGEWMSAAGIEAEGWMID